MKLTTFVIVRRLLTATLIALACFGCNVGELDFSNLEGPKLGPNVAIPLGTLSYTMRELIEKVGDSELNLEEDSTSLIHLSYYDTATFNSGSDIIQIVDIVNNEKIYVDEVPSSTESQVVQLQEHLTFKYPAEKNERVDSVFYTAGELVLSVRSFLAHDIDYDISLANTRRISDNSEVTFSGSLAANSSTSSSVDLEGHKTILAFSEDQGNIFGLTADITLFLGPDESVALNDSIEINLLYRDQEFSIIYGRFGQDTLDVGNETLDVKFFSDLGESGLRFGSPEINFHFSSSFGLPLGVLFKDMYGVDSTSSGNDTTYLTGSAATTPQIIAGATTPGEFEESTVSLNTSNSSLRALLGTSPNTIGFSLTSITNPEVADAFNYIMDDSRISTNIEMKLPMELSLENLTQELDFDLGGGLNFDKSDSVNIRLITDNEFPFSAKVGLSVLNENDSVLYNIPSKLVLEIPFLNLDGVVSQPRRQVSDIPIGKEGIDALSEGSTLRLTFTLNSPSGTRDIFVKILANYRLSVTVSAIGKLDIDL